MIITSTLALAATLVVSVPPPDNPALVDQFVADVVDAGIAEADDLTRVVCSEPTGTHASTCYARLPKEDAVILGNYTTSGEVYLYEFGGSRRTATPSTTTTITTPSTATCSGSRRHVEYHADGSGTGSITMAKPDGTEQGEVNLPMKNQSGTKGIHFCADVGEFVYISVQNRDSSGSVECSIVVDGVEVASNRSVGGYVIAACDGVAR